MRSEKFQLNSSSEKTKPRDFSKERNNDTSWKVLEGACHRLVRTVTSTGMILSFGCGISEPSIMPPWGLRNWERNCGERGRSERAGGQGKEASWARPRRGHGDAASLEFRSRCETGRETRTSSASRPKWSRKWESAEVKGRRAMMKVEAVVVCW